MARCVSSPRLQGFKLLSRDCLLATLARTTVRVNSLLFVGCQILQKSKVFFILISNSGNVLVFFCNERALRIIFFSSTGIFAK